MININNIVILCGRLTADPELKTVGSGVEVCSFTIAVDRGRPKQGEAKETDFINCTAWRQTGVFVSKYFSKGKLIKVLGSLQGRKYEEKDTGKKRTAWDVQVEHVDFVGGKSDGQSAPAASGSMFEPVSQSDATDEDFPF